MNVDTGWQLEEDEIRRKVVELLDGMNMNRLNLWLFTGITSGVIVPDLVDGVLEEEIERRSPHVREYWLGEDCTCGLRL